MEMLFQLKMPVRQFVSRRPFEGYRPISLKAGSEWQTLSVDLWSSTRDVPLRSSSTRSTAAECRSLVR